MNREPRHGQEVKPFDEEAYQKSLGSMDDMTLAEEARAVRDRITLADAQRKTGEANNDDWTKHGLIQEELDTRDRTKRQDQAA